MEQTLAYVRGERERYLTELTQYLGIPSISSSPEHRTAVAECAEATAKLLRDAGLEDVAVHPTAGHPVVTGSWLKAPGRPTVLIYGHYDVQPVDPIELWEKPPFEAHIKKDRLIARGSADDKGQVYMHIKAVEALIRKEGKLPLNVKFIIEGEEEVGSPNLGAFLQSHQELLKSDVCMISDSQMWAEGVPAITYGLRGLTYLEVEFTGPNRDLHSGSFGGAVANPAEMLARMLGQAKNSHGRIQIPGFYDDVRELTPVEREAFAKIPFNLTEYLGDLNVEELWGEEPFTPLERTWARPTFEINGVWGGFTGTGAKTVLPAKAAAKLSMRLVPDQDPDKIAALVEDWFVRNAPKSVTVKMTRHHGGRPVIVPLDNPYMGAATKALREAFNCEPLFIREGGSIPIVADFKSILGVDTLLIGYALPDNRAHSPNENFHIPTMFKGIESLVHLLHYL